MSQYKTDSVAVVDTAQMALTTVQRLSLPLDAAKLCVPWGKVAVYNNGTGQTVTIKKLTVVARKVG